jgi:hypothetical protein
MKVIIEKELDAWWGVEDLLAAMPEATEEEKQMALMELVNEDVCALLDGASFRFEPCL